jgi:hypothetical protein
MVKFFLFVQLSLETRRLSCLSRAVWKHGDIGVLQQSPETRRLWCNLQAESGNKVTLVYFAGRVWKQGDIGLFCRQSPEAQ